VEQSNSEQAISRRSLLRGAGLGLVGMIAIAIGLVDIDSASAATKTKTSKKKSKAADVSADESEPGIVGEADAGDDDS